MQRGVAALVAVMLVFGGCLTPDADTGSDSGPAGDAAAAAPTRWTDCAQWHLHFDARAEDLQSEAPPGFTVAADGNGLTTFLIHVTLCADIQEALLAVPVVAPPEHSDANRSSLAVIQVFHAGHGHDLYPAPFDARLVDARFARTDAPTGPTLTVTGGGEAFTLTLSLAPSSGGFGGEHWIRFAHDGHALGVVTADGNESTTRGFGPVAYTHQGPGGAPPATAGIAHVVDRLDLEFTKEIRS